MFINHKIRLFFIVVPIIIILIFSGCPNKMYHINDKTPVESHDYCYDLENGLRNLKPT